jgi:hypothetical protein
MDVTICLSHNNRKKHKISVYKNTVLTGTFGCNSGEATQHLIEKNNDLVAICDINGGKGEMRIGFWYGKLRERDHLKDIGVRIIFKNLH